MNRELNPLTQQIDTRLSQFTDQETVDLIVIGSGGAGFSAALNAAIDGAACFWSNGRRMLEGQLHCQPLQIGRAHV